MKTLLDLLEPQLVGKTLIKIKSNGKIEKYNERIVAIREQDYDSGIFLELEKSKDAWAIIGGDREFEVI